MIQFNKPTNLNGNELIDELKSAGVTVNGIPEVDAEGFLHLDIQAKDEAKAQPIVAAHNGTDGVKELTVAEKLASVGLSVADLKTALGL
jgi:hypothetical protein